MTVDYDAYYGGNSPSSAGLAAQATWTTSGNQLTIELTNLSTGVPAGATASDSLLVSLAFDLGAANAIVTGDSVVIGAGSFGLGSWSSRVAGDSIADQWIWTNDGSGDLLADFRQVITTSNGLGGATPYGFGGMAAPNVSGPFGGIAADPPVLGVPETQPAVCDSILITLTLTSALSDADLTAAAHGAVVEFGSDFAYVTTVPAPSGLALIAIGLLGGRRRRGA